VLEALGLAKQVIRPPKVYMQEDGLIEDAAQPALSILSEALPEPVLAEKV